MLITSPHNPRVKAAARLREPRGRARQGRIIIDGGREISRALDGGLAIREVFVLDGRRKASSSDWREKNIAEIIKRLAAAGAEIWETTLPVFRKLAFGERHEGIVAVADRPRRALSDVRLPPDALVGVLEGVEKPGNLGAVLRSADGAGVSALVVADSAVDLYNPNAIRASLGTIFTLPVCAATSADTLAWLRKNELALFAARVDAETLYHQCDFRRPSAIVLGSEAEGLSTVWQAAHITPISLPMRGRADSLNVSASAAILFYEALRQRSSAVR